MTYEEAEREWWATRCQTPPVDEHGRFIFFGVRNPATPARAALTVPVRPGFGPAAFKAGCEDEWANAMEARYGGHW